MKNRFKISKEIFTIITDLKKEYNINVKKTAIVIASIGVVVVIGTSVFALKNHKQESNARQVEQLHSPYRQEVILENSNKTSLIDFENYDPKSLDKFEDNVSSLYNADDAISYRAKYEDLVKDKAHKWGIDPNLAMAILTQESRSGKTDNLMQINFKVWSGVPFTVYDFENNKYVDILLTNDPVLYQSDKYLTISEQDLKNPITNISIGLAMYQSCCKSMNYNTPASTQCYNYGPTTMNNLVFPRTFEQTYQSKDNCLNDQYNFCFMNYTDEYELGDNDYFYNVSRFFSPSDGSITIKEMTADGVVVDHVFNWQKLIREYDEYKEEQLSQIL